MKSLLLICLFTLSSSLSFASGLQEVAKALTDKLSNGHFTGTVAGHTHDTSYPCTVYFNTLIAPNPEQIEYARIVLTDSRSSQPNDVEVFFDGFSPRLAGEVYKNKVSFTNYEEDGTFVSLLMTRSAGGKVNVTLIKSPLYLTCTVTP